VHSTLSFSSVAQQLVASGVPAVLAMQETIDQDVATYFINRLYAQWLSAGSQFEDALTQARQSVYQKFSEQIVSWAIPVLYVCPGVQLLVDNTIGSIETKERQIDAALPQQTRVGKETDMVVLIRAPAMPGLREIFDAQPRDFDATPDDVRTSSTFEVSFPVDENTGKVLPTNVKIVIETADFDLPRFEDKVQVRPQGDSVLCLFPIIPKREGNARLLIRVLGNQEQITLAQLLLRVQVHSGDLFETEYQVIDADHVKAKAVKESMMKELMLRQERQAVELLTEIRELSQFLHALVFPTHEQLAYSRRYIQCLAMLLTERDIESNLLQQINTLKESLRTIESESSGKQYFDAVMEWEYRFLIFMHLLCRELGEERFIDLLRSISARVQDLEFRCPECGANLPPIYTLIFHDSLNGFLCTCPICEARIGENPALIFESVERVLERLEYKVHMISQAKYIYDVEIIDELNYSVYKLRHLSESSRRKCPIWRFNIKFYEYYEYLLLRLDRIIHELERKIY
jgi:hypothetical protein